MKLRFCLMKAVQRVCLQTLREPCGGRVCGGTSVRSPIAALVFCAILGAANNAEAQYTKYLDGSALPGNSGWTVDGAAGTIVDLGGGNFGIQQTDDDPNT